ncbi:hypothetical protein VNO78_05501 [Psophocarpus tetragonolobus]|uniref:Uncharacterized protein n=1 Tax=Psophocarpus tetragonolobus TaxID=3891 RepID=A0AAN9STR0_PSOTE
MSQQPLNVPGFSSQTQNPPQTLEDAFSGLSVSTCFFNHPPFDFVIDIPHGMNDPSKIISCNKKEKTPHKCRNDFSIDQMCLRWFNDLRKRERSRAPPVVELDEHIGRVLITNDRILSENTPVFPQNNPSLLVSALKASAEQNVATFHFPRHNRATQSLSSPWSRI